MRTISAKAKDVARKWYLVDADNQVVGRVAVKVANLLRGKNKPIFTPHVDTGDHVVVINAAKAVFTGKKETAKSYMSFSGYIGGHKSESVQEYRDWETDRKSTRLKSSHSAKSRMPSSA